MQTSKRRGFVSKLMITAGIVGAVALGGCAIDPEEELDDLTEIDGDDGDDEATSSVSSELGGCNQCNNCVDYARCRQPRLPYGLTSWSEKVSKINSHRPRAGCVAMIQTSSYYGHVAYVNKVSGSRIFIDEGNWNGCNRRSGTAAALNIKGYWCRK